MDGYDAGGSPMRWIGPLKAGDVEAAQCSGIAISTDWFAWPVRGSATLLVPSPTRRTSP